MLGLEKVLGGVALALAIAASVQTWRLSSEQTAHQQTKLDWMTERDATSRAALRAQAEYNQEAENDRKRAQQANEDAKTRIDALAANLAVAGTERERLQHAYATAVARRCEAAGTPAIAGPSAAASAPRDLLADVPGRIDAAADRIAEFAERAMSAAEACKSAW